ncbi:MAG TPA: integrin alpha, partial [Candidatus Obscuribacterales bacterium]
MTFDPVLNLAALNGSNGFRIDGVAEFDNSGFSVSSAGDINGDGIDDLIIGATSANSNGLDSGSSYVVFGSVGGFNSTLNLSSLDGSNGFSIYGVTDFNYFGRSVSGGGDINGDGFDDLIIGAFVADPNGNTDSGSSYVVFGSGGGFSSILNLSSLDGSNGFRIDGVAAFDYSGRSVSSAGDVNGDGFDDLIIGSYRADPNGTNSGSSYVVFGSDAGFSSTLNLSALTGSNGFRIDGVAADDRSGFSVSSAGDINGDGFDDLIIGSYRADPNS